MFESFVMHFFGLMEAFKNLLVGMGIEDIGWLSTVILALCGLPLLHEVYKTGTTKSPFLFLIGCFLGETLGLFYVFAKQDLILTVNYGFNTVVYGIVLWYKLRPRRKDD